METSRTFGYTRVSTKEQNDDRQLTAMADFGVSPENIYRDKQSGKNFIRPAYSKLISSLAPGDILVIKSIDRLGRYISKELQVAIVVLDLPILDTRQKDRLDLTGTLIADIVLTLLSYVAETERVNIRQRQLEGIEAAKRRGIRFGRPNKPVPAGFDRLFTAWSEKQISARFAAAELGTSHQTFLKWCGNC